MVKNKNIIKISLFVTNLLNKGFFSPGDKLSSKITVVNNSNKKIRITKVRFYFDWLKTIKEKESCSINLNIVIPPKKNRVIEEPFSTKIPLSIAIGNHPWETNFDLEYESENGWEKTDKRPDKSKHLVLIKQSNNKNFNIFISHRICQEDKNLIDRISNSLKNIGFNPYRIEKDPQSNPSLWGEIEEKIFKSDCFLFIWTKYSAKKQGEIREELGKANMLKKPILCLAETNNLPSSIKHIKYTKLIRKKQTPAIEELLASINAKYELKLELESKNKKMIKLL